jgi:sulfur relay (sulfurtransferase) DsrF/TusC family protein
MTIYVIQSQAPDHPASWHGQAMYLALATMELNPQLVLLGDGLQHLQQGHDAQHDERSLQKRYALLDLYECPTPLVVTENGFMADPDWVMDVEPIANQQLAQRLASAGKVLRF